MIYFGIWTCGAAQVYEFDSVQIRKISDIVLERDYFKAALKNCDERAAYCDSLQAASLVVFANYDSTISELKSQKNYFENAAVIAQKQAKKDKIKGAGIGLSGIIIGVLLAIFI